MPRRSPPLLAILAGAMLLAGCVTTPGPPPDGTADPGSTPSAVRPDGEPRVVASGLTSPWSVVPLPGAPGEALVSERDTGRVLHLAADGAVTPVGTVPGVAHGGEGGLLGLALLAADAPEADGTRWLYAYLTTASDNRIVRMPLPDSLALGAPETVLTGLERAGNHNGGRIAFGPDGMLYATVGDAGRPELAQDPRSPNGKILRMTPRGEAPDDNPFPGSLVYSLGHRNPQGIAWDESGTMYASEFGQNTWDELNVIEPGGNYGWPEVEGIAGEQGYIDPVQQWEPGEASPSGIAVHAGSIWIANLRGESLREVPLADLTASTRHYVGEYGRIRDAVLSPDGHLWMVTNNTDGRGDPGPGDDRILSITRI